MENQKNQRLIEEQLKSFSIDRLEFKLEEFQDLGLQLSRQRLRGVLGESSNITVPDVVMDIYLLNRLLFTF